MHIDVPANEHDMIRVFAVNRAPMVMRGAIKTLGKERLAAELLGQAVPRAGFELFPVADLEGVGLTRYLGDGYAVPQEQLNTARQRLEGLDGYVLLVFSSAFEGQGLRLTPSAELTLIGTFGEAQPDMSVTPLESEAAQMQAGSANAQTLRPKRPAGSLIVLAVILLAGLAPYVTLR